MQKATNGKLPPLKCRHHRQESRVFICKCLVKYHLSRDGQTQKHQCRLAQLMPDARRTHHKHTQQMTKVTKPPTSHESPSQMPIANRIVSKKSNLVIDKVGPRTSPKTKEPRNLQTSPNDSPSQTFHTSSTVYVFSPDIEKKPTSLNPRDFNQKIWNSEATFLGYLDP